MARRPFVPRWALFSIGFALAGPALTQTTPADSVDPFASLGRSIAEGYTDIESVVVVQRGRTVFESYRDGSETLRDLQSVTKSVVSVLSGIALGQGHLRSLDRPVVELMPELAAANDDPRANRITVAHLLTMSSGFDAAARVDQLTAGVAAGIFARPLVAAPGERFRYDNRSTDLLAVLLSRLTGQDLAAFARQQLFEPLGVEAFDWRRGADGHALGGWGLKLRTRDMARLGQLMLQQGRWAGRQILAEGYALASTARQSDGGAPIGLPYGHLWWIAPAAVERKSFFASGFGGQLVWVHPPLELVVAITSQVSAASNARGQAISLVRNQIYGAALRNAQPPHPAATASSPKV